MSLPRAPDKYSQDDQQRLRRAIEGLDEANRKAAASVEIAPKQKLIMYDTVTGARGYLSVASGTLTWTTF